MRHLLLWVCACALLLYKMPTAIRVDAFGLCVSGHLETGRDLDQYIEYHPDTKKHKCMLCKFLTNRPAKVLRQSILLL